MSMVHNNVLESALRETGLGEDQDKLVITVAEVESLLTKVFCRETGSEADQHNCQLSVKLSLAWIRRCYGV